MYRAWIGMHRRCYGESSRDMRRLYKDRGIYVCEEWHDVLAFAEWAKENGCAHGLELDRIDNDGPYGPDNCRFVTRKANSRNRRTNVRVTAFGETKCLVEWSEDPRCVVSYATFTRRVRQYGWDPEEALVTLPGQRQIPKA